MQVHGLNRLLVTLSAFALLGGLTPHSQGSEPWDTFSDTWVATDALGRSVPTNAEVGGPRTNKTVGIFYFLWLGSHGRALHDNTKILAANPDNPVWGPKGAFHFWGEPLFGHYLSDDESVLRKHAQMLSDAGIDVLIFDVTNGFTYDDVFLRLCRVFTELRAMGNRTPQFAFIAHSGEGDVVRRLHQNFYAKNLHPDLWFRWKGKPLVLAAPKALTPELNEFFTVRESWAWSDPKGWFGDGRDRWPWLDHHPQNPGWHERADRPEQMPVSAAQHPTSNIGRSFQNRRQPPPGQTSPELGLCFAEQWKRALEVDPEFVFITGWNEWVAQRFISEKGGQPFLGKPLPPGGSFFVDQFNQEFSRDIEPMRGGHGDNYFYQMVANIRRYKGARAVPTVQSRPIVIDGRFEDWKDVLPEFRDPVGDPVQRDHDGWTGAGRQVNHTGCNDLIAAKVSADKDHVYFYARCRGPLSAPGTNWMLLLIDIDQNPRTGWLGYDRCVNRLVPDEDGGRFERNAGGRYEWGSGVRIAMRWAGNELELAVPRDRFGQAKSFDFKWADNILQTGEWSDFTLNGDAAPNDRFNYRAVLPP